ncbi:autotransporter outer membrane beta-barrel domain-containing protein [Labrys okinawensis]|uniref:autotransporter outer membrane beta-barrel domain-containing protein n=1 Tax=Labrys okinawensis TaxID=346911 RepID=UPI0039BD7FA8
MLGCRSIESATNQTTGDDEGWSTALSLGVGKRFTLGSGWAVVPQAQLAWTHVDFDSFIDENGSLNELGKGDSLRGRGGLRLEKLDTWKGEDGQVRRVQLYGVANLSYEFLDGTSVEVDSTEIDQQEKKLWGEIGLGGTYAWNDEWSLNGEASYGAALASNAGSNYAVKGTVSLRYRW